MQTMMKTCGAIAFVALISTACGGNNQSAARVGLASIPECDVYIKRVDACLAKVDMNNQMAASLKQRNETFLEELAASPDKSGIARTCKLSNDEFAPAASLLRCE